MIIVINFPIVYKNNFLQMKESTIIISEMKNYQTLRYRLCLKRIEDMLRIYFINILSERGQNLSQASYRPRCDIFLGKYQYLRVITWQ